MLRKFRLGLVIAGLAIAGSLTVTGTAASAAVPSAVPAVTAADDVTTQSARGCTGRNGPGDVNHNCISVSGSSLYVKQIRGSMESSSVPLNPEICDVTVHVWGTLSNGARYDRTGLSRCSSIGYAYVDFWPYHTFKDRTMICSRTKWGGEWSSPACITIKK